MFLALLVALPSLAGISLIVFGGGQVFIPIFTQMWHFLEGVFGADINNEVIRQTITIANFTPGVVSTKLALFTGYLVANGQIWGYVATLLTYSAFALPALFMTVLGMKLIRKTEKNRYLENVVLYLKPVIAGIGLSLMIQLFLGLILPYVEFNSSININDYIKNTSNSKLAVFFSDYRLTILQVYVPLVVLLDIYLLRNLKIHLFLVILINLGIGFLAFQPWR